MVLSDDDESVHSEDNQHSYNEEDDGIIAIVEAENANINKYNDGYVTEEDFDNLSYPMMTTMTSIASFLYQTLK